MKSSAKLHIWREVLTAALVAGSSSPPPVVPGEGQSWTTAPACGGRCTSELGGGVGAGASRDVAGAGREQEFVGADAWDWVHVGGQGRG